MSEVLQICQLGNPVLRQQARAIADIGDKRIQKLIDNLIATVAPANGVGIAAPQVAESYRLFIIASRPTLRYPQAPTMQPTPMINPRIVASSSDVVKDWEGCLSIPGIRALVPRARAIEIEYNDRNGKLHRKELTDFVARIFQHEYDHLEGKVFLDRVESTMEIITEDEYQKRVVLKQ